LSDHYNSDRWMYGDAHQKLVDSGDWREHIDLHRHRYMTEDVVFGLAFLDSVAQWAACEARVTRGLLAVAGAILGRDLREGPRTLAALSLHTKTPEQLKELLREGET
jgi:opine dehydrogenase